MTICENIEYYTDLFDAQNGDIGLKNTIFRIAIKTKPCGFGYPAFWIPPRLQKQPFVRPLTLISVRKWQNIKFIKKQHSGIWK